MKLSQLTITTDSRKLSETLNDWSSTNCINDGTNLISFCRDLLDQMGNPTIIHDIQSTIAVVDLLANEGNKLGSNCFWKEWIVPPLFVHR